MLDRVKYVKARSFPKGLSSTQGSLRWRVRVWFRVLFQLCSLTQWCTPNMIHFFYSMQNQRSINTDQSRNKTLVGSFGWKYCVYMILKWNVFFEHFMPVYVLKMTFVIYLVILILCFSFLWKSSKFCISVLFIKRDSYKPNVLLRTWYVHIKILMTQILCISKAPALFKRAPSSYQGHCFIFLLIIYEWGR